jgi:four helix bundle protein
LRAATISCRDFRGMARGSASELEYQLLLAKDLGLLEAAGYYKLAEQTTENQTYAHGADSKS